jgi:hypothetical protein
MPDEVDLSYLHDPKLSWRAKGLLTWLHSQPPGASPRDALHVCPDEAELQAAVIDLQTSGYVFVMPGNPFEPTSSVSAQA